MKYTEYGLNWKNCGSYWKEQKTKHNFIIWKTAYILKAVTGQRSDNIVAMRNVTQ